MNSSGLRSQQMILPLCPVAFIEQSRVRKGRQQSSVSVDQTVLICFLVIHILTFPLTAFLNALVMIAVKTKRRLRANKSNILLACLASTDFVVGVVAQPLFIAMVITVLVDETTSALCTLQVATRHVPIWLCHASIFHLALVSVERYLAMKHTFQHSLIVTEARLLIASFLAWFLSVVLRVVSPLFNNQTVFFAINVTFIALAIIMIVFCHITVYQETRRHEKQLATQQVTREERETFLKDRKVLKLTSIIVTVLFLCYMPLFIFRFVSVRYLYKMPLAASFAMLNSFINPLIYTVRMKQFRNAFVELVCCRTVNIVEPQ